MQPAKKLRYAVVQRLRMIDVLLDEFGYVNRSVLCSYFGVSSVQASHDLKEYIALAPNNLSYDPRSKRYKRNPYFKLVFP